MTSKVSHLMFLLHSLECLTLYNDKGSLHLNSLILCIEIFFYALILPSRYMHSLTSSYYLHCECTPLAFSLFEQAYFFSLTSCLAWCPLTYLLNLFLHLFQMLPYQRGFPWLHLVQYLLPSSSAISISLICFIFSIVLNTIWYIHIYFLSFLFPLHPFPNQI